MKVDPDSHEIRRLDAVIAELRAENERLRDRLTTLEPVWEAAKAWRAHYGRFPRTDTYRHHNALVAAVNAVEETDYAYSQGDHDRVVLKLGGQRVSWATPAAREAGGTPEQFLMRKRKAKQNGSELGESLTSLSMQAASWATPTAFSSRGVPDAEQWMARKRRGRPGSAAITELNMQAQMTKAAWPTATAHDGTKGGKDTADQCRARDAGGPHLASAAHSITGASSNGSPAPTASCGQLNPDLSRWLQGYPAAWLFAAPTKRPAKKSSTGTTAAARSPDSATRSSRRSARSSSAAPKKRGGR